MKNIAFLFFLIPIISCQFDAPDKTHTPKVVDASKAIFNWTCIPGEKIGLIGKSFTEGDIIKAYGVENVSRKEVGLGEGEMANATIVFPNTENEISIIWKRTQPYKVIEQILIDHPDASWTTNQGIGIGTTLEELVKINGKDFQFAGFEWDNSGYTNAWEGGTIPQSLVVYLEPSKPEAIYPDLLGDSLFPSNHPKAKKADLKVRGLAFRF